MESRARVAANFHLNEGIRQAFALDSVKRKTGRRPAKQRRSHQVGLQRLRVAAPEPYSKLQSATPLIERSNNVNIVNRVLTLNHNVANGTVECIAGCRVELSAFEIAALAIPGNPGFTLRCKLEGVDVGPDTDLFTFPLSRTFNNILNLLDANDIFRSTVSEDILNEDVNGADEIRAVFTLVNNSTGQSVRKRSATHQIVL